jgi:hypothetical protein
MSYTANADISQVVWEVALNEVKSRVNGLEAKLDIISQQMALLLDSSGIPNGSHGNEISPTDQDASVNPTAPLIDFEEASRDSQPGMIQLAGSTDSRFSILQALSSHRLKRWTGKNAY